MDHIDPVQIRGFQTPMTSEVAAESKKKLKESKMDTYEEAIESSHEDAFIPSEASQSLPERKKEAFLEDAKSEIAKLDPYSESFVDDAAGKLVNSALKKEYGDKIEKKPGYRQMEKVLKQRILMDPRYRPIIEDFLGRLLESEETQHNSEASDTFLPPS